jgi:hypothetical protein
VSTEQGPERYFYHSFPRRSRKTATENEKGCQILSIMRDVGLLLTPEPVEWGYEHADGSAPRTSAALQRRVCFTELAPKELPGHAEKFGRFALEFSVPALKSLGAIPVFYIPRAISGASGAEAAAGVLVMQFIDAIVLLTRIAKVREMIGEGGEPDTRIPCTFGFTETGSKTFELGIGEIRRVLDAFTHAITPPDMLLSALEGMLNFFYPADDWRHDEALGYYREREWRVAANIAIRGVDMMQRPDARLIERLKALDHNFFARQVHPDSDRCLAEEVLVLPGLGGKHILQMARRVIVPREAVSDAVALLSGLPDAPAVVALDSLVE